jgi:L-malate glycosyltransferase
MRLAIIMDLAPRKLGSFEDWIIAMCRVGRERGHEIDVYGRTPIHSVFKARLDQLVVGWNTLDGLLASRLSGIRRLQGYDVIHLNMFGPRSPIALMGRAAYPARVIFVDHRSGPVPGTETTRHPAVNVFRRSLDLLTMVRIHRMVGVSEYVTNRNRNRFGLSNGRARTIYNGVDVRRFTPTSQRFDLHSAHAVPEARTLNVATVAYLVKQKGIDHLIRAVARARNRELRLIIGGDGPEQPNLAALASDLAIADRVEFLGLRDDIPSLLAAADIFVHPAIWEEAFGLTIVEAMALQRPVIATRIGAIPELIEHHRSGLLVEPGNADELAQALDLLSEQPALRRHLAVNARARAEQQFTMRRCALDHVRCCEESVAAKARPVLERTSRGRADGALPSLPIAPSELRGC